MSWHSSSEDQRRADPLWTDVARHEELPRKYNLLGTKPLGHRRNSVVFLLSQTGLTLRWEVGDGRCGQGVSGCFRAKGTGGNCPRRMIEVQEKQKVLLVPDMSLGGER